MIDEYFDNISSEELYRISKEKYGFEDDISLEISDNYLNVVNINEFISNKYISDYQPQELANKTLPRAS